MNIQWVQNDYLTKGRSCWRESSGSCGWRSRIYRKYQFNLVTTKTLLKTTEGQSAQELKCHQAIWRMIWGLKIIYISEISVLPSPVCRNVLLLAAAALFTFTDPVSQAHFIYLFQPSSSLSLFLLKTDAWTFFVPQQRRDEVRTGGTCRRGLGKQRGRREDGQWWRHARKAIRLQVCVHMCYFWRH